MQPCTTCILPYLRENFSPMNLHEYQAKELLKKYNVPVQEGTACASVQEAEEAYRNIQSKFGSKFAVVKAQIHAGGRGKGTIKETGINGVKVGKSQEEIADFAQKILGGTLVTLQTGAAGKVVNKGVSTARKSVLSSLKDYAQQGSTEHDEKLEKLKKQPIIERLRYLYGDNTFSGRYGIDIMKVCLVIFLFMCAVTYFQIQIRLNEVKQDWPKYRCRPDVMPFAGWINAPEGTDPMEYTKQNFTECSSNITKGVFDKPMVMVYAGFNVVMKIFKNILDVIEKLRLFLNKIRDTIKDLFLAIFNRIQNVIIPVQVMLIKMVDFFEKIKGILATFLLTFVGVLWSFYSLIGSVYELMIIILVVMVIIIIALWYIPFVGWVLAIAALAIFLTIAIPLILLGIVSRQITRQRTSRMPGP